MYKKAKILIFCMIFVAGSVFCQDSIDKLSAGKDIFYTKLSFQNSVKFSYNSFFQKAMYTRSVRTDFNKQQIIIINPVSCAVIGADFYTRNFGFFCKKELEFEKVTKIPLRFRLGSLQYNDYLEGKPNAGILPAY